MRLLNSCIIEGSMGSSPDENGKFYITHDRTSKNSQGEEIVCKSHFFVVVNGKMRKIVSDFFEKGRGIRVVGYLKTDKKGCAEIIAEHIEFKPTLNN